MLILKFSFFPPLGIFRVFYYVFLREVFLIPHSTGYVYCLIFIFFSGRDILHFVVSV